jgi:hypothetical protein
MGLEGAVRLGMARELAALPEPEREAAVAAHTADLRKHAKALNAARMFEIDDVIDPAETRALVAATFRRARGPRHAPKIVLRAPSSPGAAGFRGSCPVLFQDLGPWGRVRALPMLEP